MDAQKFGAFVAQCRKDKKMTQADLAAKLHVTDKAISRWERGVRFPDINTLEPLAAALGISVAELMRSERLAEADVSMATSNKIVSSALDLAKNQIQTERKRAFSIIGCLAIMILFILYLDNVGWKADTILFTAFGVILPLVAALSSIVLLGYSLHRKRKGKSGRQTFLIALISFCVVAIIFLAFVFVGLFGLGPTPQ